MPGWTLWRWLTVGRAARSKMISKALRLFVLFVCLWNLLVRVDANRRTGAKRDFRAVAGADVDVLNVAYHCTVILPRRSDFVFVVNSWVECWRHEFTNRSRLLGSNSLDPDLGGRRDLDRDIGELGSWGRHYFHA